MPTPDFLLALGHHHGVFSGKGEAGGWSRMVCSNGWRCEACPVAEGLFCSSSMQLRWQQRKAKILFLQTQRCFGSRQAHCDSNPSVCCVRTPWTWEVATALLSCRRAPHPSGPRRRTDEGRRSPGLGWNKRCRIISASLLLLPPYILSTSIKSNRLLAACRVISRGCVCCALGSRAACIL